MPVGKDNVAHVEVTREIARRFNFLYGETFPVPDVMVSDFGSLVGTDGNAKMSKCLNNAIFLSDDEKTVQKRVMSMYTDPKRISADIPGTVEGNPVFQYHDAFNPNKAEVEDLKERYRLGKVGDVEVKEKLVLALNAFLDPIRERRAKYESQSGPGRRGSLRRHHENARRGPAHPGRREEGDGHERGMESHIAQGRGREEEEGEAVGGVRPALSAARAIPHHGSSANPL